MAIYGCCYTMGLTADVEHRDGCERAALIEAFTAPMEAKTRGRVAKSLNLAMRYRGEVMPRIAIIEAVVAEGWRVEEFPASKAAPVRLTSADGVFLSEDTLTGYGMAYARWRTAPVTV